MHRADQCEVVLLPTDTSSVEGTPNTRLQSKSPGSADKAQESPPKTKPRRGRPRKGKEEQLSDNDTLNVSGSSILDSSGKEIGTMHCQDISVKEEDPANQTVLSTPALSSLDSSAS